jgi:hypothetical protein
VPQEEILECQEIYGLLDEGLWRLLLEIALGIHLYGLVSKD